MTRPAIDRPETWLVTGGAGFIGCNFVRSSLGDPGAPGVHIVVYDKLTYAGRLENLADVADHPRYSFIRGDIADRDHLSRVLAEVRPDAVIHLAAESHVDRSIDGPAAFIQTNIVGTFTLVEACRDHLTALPAGRRERFRFLHVSTDEVYGSAGPDDAPFDETAPYAPSSPYAASKASSDHLVAAAHTTFGFPAIITHAANNHGPYQFPEKFLPVITLRALERQIIPIYGDGRNERDWLSVHDHCDAIRLVLRQGEPGQHYNVAAENGHSNLDLAHRVCAIVDELAPGQAPASELIRFVTDRPGHDRRYAIDAGKIRQDLGWRPTSDFSEALRHTVAWYIENRAWCDTITRDGHEHRRLGLEGRAEGTHDATNATTTPGARPGVSS